MSETLARVVPTAAAAGTSGGSSVNQRKPYSVSQPLASSCSAAAQLAGAPIVVEPAGGLASPAVPIRSARGPEQSSLELGLGLENEIRRILQHGVAAESPQTTFLGVSPPTRSMGAANPLVQDALWRQDPYRASHCNLQALREMDARCGGAFLRSGGACGDYRLLVGSPDVASLGGLSAASEADGDADVSVFGGTLGSLHSQTYVSKGGGGFDAGVVPRCSASSPLPVGAPRAVGGGFRVGRSGVYETVQQHHPVMGAGAGHTSPVSCRTTWLA